MTQPTDAPVSPAPTGSGSLGLLQGTALYIAAVLGTGILVLPGLAAAAAGPASLLAVLIVFVLSIPLAGTFAALAARYPDPGGVASYVRTALGQTWARMTGYWFFFGVGFGAPVVAMLGAEYVVAILGVEQAAAPIVALLILVPPFVSNYLGVRVSGAVQLILTGALLVIVIGVVTVAFPAAEPGNFQPFLTHGWTGVGAAVSLFVWAFAGWEVGTHIAGEFRNPRRVIPAATAIALVVVGAAYLALQYVTVAVLGGAAGTGAVPLLALVAQAPGGVGPVSVAVIAAIVALGVLNVYLGAFAKLGASLGRDGDLPLWLARGVESGGVPRRSLSVVAVLTGGYFTIMVTQHLPLSVFILIHTSSMVAIYTLGMIAAVRLLDRYSLGWWLAAVSVALTGALLVLAGPNLLVPAVLALVAVVIGRVKKRRTNPLRSRTPEHSPGSARSTRPRPTRTAQENT
ncbi:amino acid permease [Cryobacterium sp. MDB1-18-2]|uniref:APC family permease n=1 Tax=unclassified Cryobacterium TaxID=2649013 RepID=UPI00106C34B3|nr:MULTISPECIES: amino acid permease [unclassified Cryobacterium]TFC36028.1 amino acid permease [Cryobacterium sp. MDB1-18-2]TFC41648.1 amino acid permease [Cryobacterium sp. MDB1-18-1]